VDNQTFFMLELCNINPCVEGTMPSNKVSLDLTID